ncbi:MAG TPA: hypothetical protein VLD13_10435 [Gaiellaceae bacterium]|nr:hypothetical protein [Gaiellaceae bacterium]
MAKKHAIVVALFLGLAAAVGGFAAIRTASLGQPQAKASTPTSQSAALVKRSRILDRQEIALRRALAKRPPKLPKVPKFKPVSMPRAPAPAQVASAPAPAASAAAPQATVRYVRPAPVIVTKHRSHEGDDGHESDHHESEHEGGDD